MTRISRKTILAGLILLGRTAASLALVPAASATERTQIAQKSEDQTVYLVRKPYQRTSKRIVEPVKAKQRALTASQSHQKAHQFNKLHCRDGETPVVTPNLYRGSAPKVR